MLPFCLVQSDLYICQSRFPPTLWANVTTLILETLCILLLGFARKVYCRVDYYLKWLRLFIFSVVGVDGLTLEIELSLFHLKNMWQRNTAAFYDTVIDFFNDLADPRPFLDKTPLSSTGRRHVSVYQNFAISDAYNIHIVKV